MKEEIRHPCVMSNVHVVSTVVARVIMSDLSAAVSKFVDFACHAETGRA